MSPTRLIAAVLLLALPACMTAPAAPGQPAVYVMRHLNTPAGERDPELLPEGQRTAALLADWFGAERPAAIYVSDFRRTRQSAAPLAARLGLTPIVYDPADTPGLVARIRAEHRTVLVVGHSNTVPDIVEQLGGTRPAPLVHEDFGDIWRVSRRRRDRANADRAALSAMDEIRTPRLLIRRARPEDLAAIHLILSDRDATLYWWTLPHATIEESRSWLHDMIAAPDAVSDDYVVEMEGRVIGKAGCWRLPEIGFIFHPDCWGRGIAREALAAIIARTFERRPIAELTADVDPRNAACLGLLTRLGFRETKRAQGTYTIGGVASDSVYLALPRPRA